mgnify:CR=1 FL=1
MPLYVYWCEACGSREEVLRAYKDRTEGMSCECGGRKVYVVSAPALHLDGAGAFRSSSRTRAEMRALERRGSVCLGGLPPHKVSAFLQKNYEEGLSEHLQRGLDAARKRLEDPTAREKAVQAYMKKKEERRKKAMEPASQIVRPRE